MDAEAKWMTHHLAGLLEGFHRGLRELPRVGDGPHGEVHLVHERVLANELPHRGMVF